jgi:hypothetical protein
MEYDLFHFAHQVPGGMMTNLKRQLGEVGMGDRLDEILEETVLVRKEFGYPVMATPYSQIVGAQAMENVVSGERYGRVTDEAVKYVLGYYGEPAAPIDKHVVDRIMSLPQAEKLRNWKPVGYDKSVEELRREIGPELSDDELLLRILIPGGHASPGRRRLGPRSRQGRPRPPTPTSPRNSAWMSMEKYSACEYHPCGTGLKRAWRQRDRKARKSRRSCPPAPCSAGWRGWCFPSR